MNLFDIRARIEALKNDRERHISDIRHINSQLKELREEEESILNSNNLDDTQPFEAELDKLRLDETALNEHYDSEE